MKIIIINFKIYFYYYLIIYIKDLDIYIIYHYRE